MFNKEFLKTLTVMYVEDDTSIRESLGAILNKVFKKVVMCVDGQDGIDKFIECQKNKDIDAIISDINMPRKNGLEMLAEIRKLDSDIPAIFTTAHGEANFLMEAIKLNVAYYALKPINTPLLLENVQKFCLAKHQQKLILKKEKELSSYINIIDNVATVIKIDSNGNFIDVNEQFCEVSSYSKEEIIGKNIKDITHPDTIASTYQEMNSTISSGHNWDGLYKCIDKNKEYFYLRLSAIPNIDDTTSQMQGCVFVGFIATEDEQEKRDTMQKVRQNIIDSKKREMILNNQIKMLEAKQNIPVAPSSSDMTFMKSSLEKSKVKNVKLLNQIKHYEKGIATLEHRLSTIAEAEMSKRQDLMSRNKILQQENMTIKESLISTKNLLNKYERKKNR